MSEESKKLDEETLMDEAAQEHTLAEEIAAEALGAEEVNAEEMFSAPHEENTALEEMPQDLSLDDMMSTDAQEVTGAEEYSAENTDENYEFLTEAEKLRIEEKISSTGIIDATKMKKRHEASNADFPVASFGKRAIAALVDGVVLTLMTAPFYLIFHVGGQVLGGVDSVMAGMMSLVGNLAQTVALVVFLSWFHKYKGGSPGKIMLGLKVVDEANGFQHLDMKKTFVREVVGKVISMMLFMVGFLMPLFNKDKKALHDMLAKTRVISIR